MCMKRVPSTKTMWQPNHCDWHMNRLTHIKRETESLCVVCTRMDERTRTHWMCPMQGQKREKRGCIFAAPYDKCSETHQNIKQSIMFRCVKKSTVRHKNIINSSNPQIIIIFVDSLMLVGINPATVFLQQMSGGIIAQLCKRWRDKQRMSIAHISIHIHIMFGVVGKSQAKANDSFFFYRDRFEYMKYTGQAASAWWRACASRSMFHSCIRNIRMAESFFIPAAL